MKDLAAELRQSTDPFDCWHFHAVEASTTREALGFMRGGVQSMHVARWKKAEEEQVFIRAGINQQAFFIQMRFAGRVDANKYFILGLGLPHCD